MSNSFPPELEQFVQKELARKQYNSRDELVVDAVRMLRASRKDANTDDNDWLAYALKQIRAIAELPSGWDSNGAPSPDPKIIQASEDLLYRLWKTKKVAKPHINPTRRGGIQLEWESGSKNFEIEFVGEKKATWLFQDTAAAVEEEGVLSGQRLLVE